jgi:DNA-binding response OmpR family regulator
MLHTFFRLMELEASVVEPDANAAATIRRLQPDAVLLDADLPNLRAVEIALDVRRACSSASIIFLTAHDSAPALGDLPLLAKPQRFEELLAVMEVVLEAELRGEAVLSPEC